MQCNTQLDDMRNKLMQLEIQVSKLSKEKVELIQNRDTSVRKGKLEVKQLEQELIDCKMEGACFKSRLQEQQNKISKLKRSLQRATEGTDPKFESAFLESYSLPKQEPGGDGAAGDRDLSPPLTYSEQLMKLNQQRVELKEMKAEEVKIEKKEEPVREIWNQSDENVEEGESTDSEGEQDPYQKSVN